MVLLLEFKEPQSPILYQQCDTKVILNREELGVGTLYVSERTLCWKQEGDGLNGGFTIDHIDISMHAVSNDITIYPQECVYILLDTVQEHSLDNDEPEDEFSGFTTTELLLLPSKYEGVNEIYNILNHAQILNPDNEDDSDLESLFEDAEGYNGVSTNHFDVGAGGDSEMNDLSNQMQNQSVCNGFNDHTDEEQFEDAD